MALKLLFSICGCTTIVDAIPMLRMIDSEKLRGDVFSIIGIKIDYHLIDINLTFVSVSEFLSYLNETFVIDNNQEGYYQLTDGYIDYYNVENYNQIEVMAIINWMMLTVDFDTLTTEYQNDFLIGAELDPRMFIDNMPAQIGYESISFNSATGTVSGFAGKKLSLSYLPPYES